jgi:hypothetical protein
MASAEKKRRKKAAPWGRESKNGPRSKTKPGSSRVSYCPHCEPVGQQRQYPQTMPHVGVDVKTKTGNCPNGHTWDVTGSVYATF